jgi:hypothetical protein
MKIHPVFHISLLEKADPETPLDRTTQLDKDQQIPEYEVERIIDSRKAGRQYKYLVK